MSLGTPALLFGTGLDGPVVEHQILQRQTVQVLEHGSSDFGSVEDEAFQFG